MATRIERTHYRDHAAIGPGTVLGLLGTAGVVLSMFVPWRTGSVYASDVHAAFLWDRHATSDPSLLIFLIPIAVVIAAGALLPLGWGLRLIGGLAALGVAGLFAYQLHRILPSGRGLGDELDVGFYAAAIGGGLAFLSGLMPGTHWPTHRVDREPRVDERVADVVDA